MPTCAISECDEIVEMPSAGTSPYFAVRGEFSEGPRPTRYNDVIGGMAVFLS